MLLVVLVSTLVFRHSPWQSFQLVCVVSRPTSLALPGGLDSFGDDAKTIHASELQRKLRMRVESFPSLDSVDIVL